MMPKIRYVSILLAFLFLAMAGSAGAQVNSPVKAEPSAIAPATAPAPIVDQRALDTLKKMSDTLSGAKTVSFEAYSMVPVKGPNGIWLNFYGTSKVIMQGPDKLFAETRGDFAAYDFYFDGKGITAYSPVKNVYAVKDMPGTIDEMIEQSYKEEGRSFPYANILIAKPYDVLVKGVIDALYVGESTIGGVKTKHLAFTNKGVEWQIWIGSEDNLPRLVNATYLAGEGEPSYTVEFSGWKVNAPVTEETFVFKNTSNAAKVEFKNPNRPSAARP